MTKKYFFCSSICAFLLFLSAPTYALQFSYDNYSSVRHLKYGFSFDGMSWFMPENFVLEPTYFKTVEFGNSIPLKWRVDAPEGKNIHCWDIKDLEKKSVKNIVTLESKTFITADDRLLDVIDYGANTIIVGIIDRDGNEQYSNMIACEVE